MIHKEQLICFHPVVEKKIRLECEYKLGFRVYKSFPKVVIAFRLSLDELLDNPVRNSVFEKLKDIYGSIRISKSVSKN
jgi:hypothetical protein